MKNITRKDKVFLTIIYLIIVGVLGYSLSTVNTDADSSYGLAEIILLIIVSIIFLFIQYFISYKIFEYINKKHTEKKIENIKKSNIYISNVLSAIVGSIVYILCIFFMKQDNNYIGLGVSITSLIVYITYTYMWFVQLNINSEVRKKYYAVMIIVNLIIMFVPL